MVQLVGYITFKGHKNVALYEDSYMEDNNIIMGRKGPDLQSFEDIHNEKCLNPHFIVANQKTANVLYNTFRKTLRKEKLNKINGYS